MSIEFRENQFLWVERYRPTSVSALILPKRIKSYLQEIVDSGEIPHILLSGSPGTGKTSSARALCNELNIDYLIINASENGNIDTLRTTIRSFASTISFTSEYKVVILDEGDSLTGSTQSALRGFMEEFANNCRFILTCNYANKIIQPIHSRCACIEFNFSKEEKQSMLIDFDKRVKEILALEKITYEKKHLAQLIIKFFPDFRRILNELQRYTKGGELQAEIVGSLSNDSIGELFGYLRSAKTWSDVRKWVAQHTDDDPNLIFRALYDKSSDFVKPGSIPQMILHIANYSYKNAFVADPEINLIACLTEIMSDCEFI